MSGDLRLVIAQLNLLVGDVTGNAECIIAAARRARDHLKAQAIVFPELSLTSYPPEDLLLRPALMAQVEEGLRRIERETRGIDVILGGQHGSAKGKGGSAGGAHGLHGVEQRANSGRDISKRLAGITAARRSNAREIVLRRRHGCRLAVAPSELETSRLHDHLKKRHIPAQPKLFALPHIVHGDV